MTILTYSIYNHKLNTIDGLIKKSLKQIIPKWQHRETLRKAREISHET